VFGTGLEDGWAVFQLPTRSYDGLTLEGKRDLFLALLGALEAVEADLQILRVERARAMRPAVFLAVSLRPPARDLASHLSSVAEHGPRGWLRWLRDAAAPNDRRLLGAGELEQLRVRADQAHRRLTGFLPARPARSVDMQWLVRRAFCRGLGEPAVDGLHEPRALVFERNGEAMLAPLEGDVLRWTESWVEHRGRSLRVESELGTSWQAQLIVGALPERASFPSVRLELMFAPPESLPFEVDLSLNARFLPNELALRIARRRIQDADQIVRAESDADQGITDQGFERTQRARDLLAHLQSSSRPPLLRATLAVAVGAADEEQLERRVEACRRAFGETRLHRPLGDQLELFCQHFPGQRTRVAGYDDTLTSEQVAAMVPIATHAVGSARGFHLGCTLSGSRRPVLLNLREGSDSDRNATILSVGALGSGKTTLDQKLKYEGFRLGARVIDCDPKGDHRFHLLEDVAPHAEVIALAPDPRLRGMLDPLRVAPVHLRHDAAVSFLCDLLPHRAEPTWETAVVRAVDAVRRRCPQPTCLEVVRALGEGDRTETQVADTLRVYAQTGLTQLGFADSARELPAVGRAQVTYLPIRDLPGPEPGTRRSELSQAERVGEQVVRLIAMFAMHLMAAERDRLKLFSFDEGWRLLKDPVGRQLLVSLQRMGRSELAVPIISTQLVGDTLVGDRESLANLVGATFVFGMRSEAEASRALALLGLDPDDRPLRRRLLDFDAGRCLFRDHRGRVEAIQVELAPALRAALSTTPGQRSAGVVPVR
jgi:hypothetical protein